MREFRKSRSAAKPSFLISLGFHVLIIVVVFVFAAREGVLGKKLRELTILIAPEPKKPEPPKEKPPEPKLPEPVKPAVVPVTAPAVVAAAPPPVAPSAAVAAPPAANLPSFDFSDGARAVDSTSDAGGLYRAQVEFSLRSHWNRPDEPGDEKYAAEVQLDMSPDGRILNWTFVKGSGDAKWDQSVKAAIKATPDIGRPRPKNFPEQFLVRFDVQTSETTDALQLDAK
jgi:outer membrane biosynthesis protein TonB